jgi:hypothetical protein
VGVVPVASSLARMPAWPAVRPILNDNPLQDASIVYVVTDSLKREGAGTVLAIKITGTRAEPSFRVEIGKGSKREDWTCISRRLTAGYASC